MVKRYFWFLFIAIDQLFNTLLGGYPDETLSSRIGKHQQCPVCRFMCWLLNFIDKDHCLKSIELDEGNRDNKH
ncbi:hypothetical protein AEA09_07295 [Lysinibacillus contaminans]|uniref:Secreted protein n=1 Tax=Lysinibacillus contaminans TaxID=1293441 RepID=A0ABR5K0V9_9BACI|nr:hypothetical protein [Lysinibacillus contaminans]KOS68379.1 hypothetical protein AEA09_07295 [Lysinibacillus contaminans]